jgi:hypothetical protein
VGRARARTFEPPVGEVIGIAAELDGDGPLLVLPAVP